MRLGGCRTGFRDLSVLPPGGVGDAVILPYRDCGCPGNHRLFTRNPRC